MLRFFLCLVLLSSTAQALTIETGKPEVLTPADHVFIDVVTLELCRALESKHVAPRAFGRVQNGRWARTEYFREVVRLTYEAAPLNPSWGEPEAVTIKLLAAWFGESGFDPNARRVNRNGSIDRGISQINDQHDADYLRFCIARDLEPRSLKADIFYGAYISEKCHGVCRWAYKYESSKRKDLTFVYYTLKKLVPIRLAERGYGKGQKGKREQNNPAGPKEGETGQEAPDPGGKGKQTPDRIVPGYWLARKDQSDPLDAIAQNQKE